MGTGWRVLAIVVASVGLLVGGGETARAEPPPADIAPGSVLVTDGAGVSTVVSIETLRTLPPQTQVVDFDTSGGPQHHTYVGTTLFDVLNVTGVGEGSADGHGRLAAAVTAIGADGYRATVAWGEISPQFAPSPVLVAYTEDGADLGRPRLVVPGDIKGGRYVTDLVELRFVDLRE